MSMKPVKTALIGSGMISNTYLDNMTKRFDILDVVGCSDIIPERSAEKAQQFGIRQMTNEEIFADPDIQIVVNTTYPKSHFEVTKQALEAGKSVQTEKMLATTFEEAKALVALSKEKSLRLGAAPDTFLGAGYQTCRKLIDDGFIGKPLMVNALLCRGYHADGPVEQIPESFVLDAGGTIPYDMGGYYIHAMVNLFGAVKRVSGFSRSNEKTYTHPKHPKYKQSLSHLTDPNVFQASLEFESGVLGSLSVCSEGFFGDVPAMTVFGTEGTLLCPDPNTYAGPVMLMRKGDQKYYEIPLTHGYSGKETFFGMPAPEPENFIMRMFADSRRGIGVADMAWGITNNRPHRCSAELGLHAIEVVHSVKESTKTDKVYTMTSHPERPEALRAGFGGSDAEGCFDD